MSEFFDMGGYGEFVWPSFALTFGIIVLNIYLARRSLRKAAAQARKRVTIATQEVSS
jgi:heme exporter protein CcmD